MSDRMMDLQLFAEEESADKAEETKPDETTEEETKAEDTAEDAEQTETETKETEAKTDDEEEGTEGERVEKEPEPEVVPLAKFMQEKKRRQELERTFAQQKSDQELQQYKYDLVGKGWREDAAEMLARQEMRLRDQETRIETAHMKTEIERLAVKKDVFFSDAEAFEDELLEKMRSLKVSAEEAYMMLRGKTRMHELQQQAEQRTAAKRKKTGQPKAQKEVETATPRSIEPKYKLSQVDKDAAAGLRKMQKERGQPVTWTDEAYYKMMYKS